MAFKSDVIIRLDKRALDKELYPKIAVKYIESAQRIVAGAVKNATAMGMVDTSNNNRRIGYAVSGMGETSLGPLKTSGEGDQSSDGSGVTTKAEEIAVVAATSSGYGAFLEIGTSRMTARPYIYPAAEQEAPKLKQSLTKIV